MNKEQKDYLDLFILILIAAFFLSVCGGCKTYFNPQPPDDAFLDSPWYLNNEAYKVKADTQYWVYPDSNYINADLDKNKSK